MNWKKHETDNLLNKFAWTKFGERVKIVEILKHRIVVVKHSCGLKENWCIDDLKLEQRG